MLIKRIVAAIIGLFLLYLFISWGSLPFLIINLLIIILGLREFFNIIDDKYKSNLYLLYFIGLINSNIINAPFGFLFLFIIITLFSYFELTRGYKNIIKSISINIFGILYIAGGLIFLIFLRDLNTSSLNYN